MLTSTFALIFLFTVSGCVSGYTNPNLPNLRPESEYVQALEDYSAKKQVYDGLYATIEFSATLLNSKVSRLQLDQYARIYQWSEDYYKTRQSEVETAMSKQTDIHLGFFVPERKHDDLHKAKTLWRIFLDVGGKRYEGKAEKIKTISADIQSLYPYHSRFYTPYRLTFPVPTSVAESADAKLTLTGPVGSTSVEFKALH